MSLLDLLSLLPFLIILLGALTLLAITTFSKNFSNKSFASLTLAIIALTGVATLFNFSSTNPLITAWIGFDKSTQFYLLFFQAIVFFVTLFSPSYLSKFSKNAGEYFFLLLASLFGLMLIGTAQDFLVLFLGLETLSLSLYILCGYIKTWGLSLESSMKYFFLGSVGAALLLYGIAFIYGAFGTTSFNALSIMPEDTFLYLIGITFITVGLLFKAAIFPFHSWAPDVYDGSPTPITAFMSVGTKVGAFVALIKVFLVTLPLIPIWNEMISILSIISLIYANFTALKQVQLRRFFAYSGIAQSAFLLIPFVSHTNDAIQSLNFYLIIYALATLASFTMLLFVDHSPNGVMIKDLKGLYYRSPLLASVLSVALLTLAGIPPTVGFLGKLYILKVAFQAGFVALTIVAVLTSIVSAFYYLRIISYLFREPKELVYFSSSRALTISAVLTTCCLIVLSIFPNIVFYLKNL